MTRVISVEQRRARLVRRHHLAPGAQAADVVAATRNVVALHSSDPASVYLAARARVRDADVPAVERALYEDRTVVRMLGMRRTLFVVPSELVPVVHAACTRAIAAKERKRLAGFVESGGTAEDGEAWIARLEPIALAAVAERGEALAAELSRTVPELGEKIVLGAGTKWATTVSAGSRMLFLLAAAGHLVRSRPAGQWTSSQYRWAPVAAWFPGGVDELETDAAQAELARRYLAAFGPATLEDLAWWTGWTKREAKRALAAVGAVEVDLGGATGHVLPDDLDDEPASEPGVALLPALDPTVMGWTGRDWYLGDHRPALFDRSGNAGPTVWWDGRVVGGWGQRPDGEVVVRLLEDVGSEAVTAAEREAERLTAWLAGVRITPRFRTPLERELSA
ncbi:MAG TPA: winged helix DNA-binding domain-containing protein [Acidimicrobiales bacterium]